MKIFIITLLSIAFCNQKVPAQVFDKTKLDTFFDSLAAHRKFMGSVAISRHQQTIYTRSLGFADVQMKRNADEHTRYYIGSITKTFTAVLVFKAVEEGKLHLDQTIDAFFPSLENASLITIANLLSHRSGIHNFTDDKDYLSWYTSPKTEQEMIDLIAEKGSDFAPGTKAAYSNSNYVLLAFILERTMKMPYGKLLQNYITAPLGLVNTYVGGKGMQEEEAKSYVFSGYWLPAPRTDMSVPIGAGNIVSTPVDLVKFSDALFSGRLLNKESLDQMKETKDHFGMGLIPFPFYDYHGYGHTGGIDGYKSVFIHFNKDSVSYALASNGSIYDINDISIAVLSAVYDKEYEIPSFKEITIEPRDLLPFTGVYSSKELPLKITVMVNHGKLSAQATGQAAFPLKAVDQDTFVFDPAGIVMQFKPQEKKMILKQGGGKYLFVREEAEKNDQR